MAGREPAHVAPQNRRRRATSLPGRKVRLLHGRRWRWSRAWSTLLTRSARAAKRAEESKPWQRRLRPAKARSRPRPIRVWWQCPCGAKAAGGLQGSRRGGMRHPRSFRRRHRLLRSPSLLSTAGPSWRRDAKYQARKDLRLKAAGVHWRGTPMLTGSEGPRGWQVAAQGLCLK